MGVMIPMGKTSILLDLGCGGAVHPGSLGIDRYLHPGVALLGDLTALPFKASTIDGCYLHHVLEHVEDVIQVLEEVWRISKPGAWIDIRVPHFSCGVWAWGNPEHRRAFSSAAFRLLSGEDPTIAVRTPARFRVEEARLSFILHNGQRMPVSRPRRMIGRVFEWLANRHLGRCERYWAQWIGFEELYVRLQALK